MDLLDYTLLRMLLIVFIHITLNDETNVEAVTKESRTVDLRLPNETSALRFLTVDMSEMDSYKRDRLAPLLIERVSGTEGNRAVQTHLKSQLRSWHIEEDTFTDQTPNGVKQFTNIIATFDPSKPTKVVLACHFDSKYMADNSFLGATDSAVPCSILLETARQLECLMQKGPQSPSQADDLTLQLIFFDGEEAFRDWTATDSLYGARHLANKWAVEPDLVHHGNKTRLQSILVFFLLDLIGTTDTTVPQQFTQTSHYYQHLVKTESYLRSNHYLSGQHAGPIFNGDTDWGGIEDDHIPFLQKGVDVVHLISAPFPSVWHQPTDDGDHLDFGLIDDFSRIFRVFVSDLLHLQSASRSCRKK